MAAPPLAPRREARVQSIRSRVLDALARDACLGAMALSAAIGEWRRADVVMALRGLVQAGAVVRAGERRSAVYRLVGWEEVV